MYRFSITPHIDLEKFKGQNLSARLRTIAREACNVVVKGYPTADQAFERSETKNGKVQKRIWVTGTDLRQIMSTKGIDGSTVRCNHIMEVEKTLGIEAARRSIMEEVHKTMESYGIKIDRRHTELMADVMTVKGDVLGITRFGIAKMKESVFMLASFEKTTDHVFEAAMRGTRDSIEGVSECIIMGVPMKIGTGLFRLLQEYVYGRELWSWASWCLYFCIFFFNLLPPFPLFPFSLDNRPNLEVLRRKA